MSPPVKNTKRFRYCTTEDVIQGLVNEGWPAHERKVVDPAEFFRLLRYSLDPDAAGSDIQAMIWEVARASGYDIEALSDDHVWENIGERASRLIREAEEDEEESDD